MAAAKRVAIACWGSLGDLFPSLEIARTLQSRGHQPVLAAPGFYRELVEGHRIEFHPMPPEVPPDDTALMSRIMDPARGSEVIVGELLAPAVRASFDAFATVARGADVIVSHPVTFAAPLVARAQRVPWISTVLAPTSFFSLHDFPLLPPTPGAFKLARLSPVIARIFRALAGRATRRWTEPIRALRAELHQPDTGEPLFEGQFSPYGTLALYSPLLGQPQPDWPPHSQITGFAFREDETPLSDDLVRFLDAGEPPVVFTLGSSAALSPGSFYEESARAAADLGLRSVSLVGRSWNGPMGETSAGQFTSAFAPHARLFARCRAIVHHGGVGTMGQAMRSGRPMLVVPHAHDQPDNAFRARRLGIAGVIDVRKYRKAEVVRTLGLIVKDRSMAARAADVGRVVSAERGADRAADAILAVADAARPT